MRLPVHVPFGATDPRRHAHDQPVGCFEAGAIGPHILRAGIGVLGNDVRGRKRRRRIETGCRQRHRQAHQPAVFGDQIFALDDHIMARRLVHQARRYRIGNRVGPFGGDAVDRRIHARRIDILVGGERADHDRNVVLATLGISGVVEQKCFALIFP